MAAFLPIKDCRPKPPLRVNVDEEDGVSVEILLDCSAEEFLKKYGKSNGKHVFGTQGEKRPLQSLDNLTISNEATFGDYLVRQYENGTIQVLESDELQQMAKPHLREIAAEIGVDLWNSNSKAKNTRQLGADIIKVLQVKSGA